MWQNGNDKGNKFAHSGNLSLLRSRGSCFMLMNPSKTTHLPVAACKFSLFWLQFCKIQSFCSMPWGELSGAVTIYKNSFKRAMLFERFKLVGLIHNLSISCLEKPIRLRENIWWALGMLEWLESVFTLSRLTRSADVTLKRKYLLRALFAVDFNYTFRSLPKPKCFLSIFDFPSLSALSVEGWAILFSLHDRKLRFVFISERVFLASVSVTIVGAGAIKVIFFVTP